MTPADLVRSFWNLFDEQKWDLATDLLHRDFTALWPQSREKMIGAKNFIDVNRYYPGNHKIEVLHLYEIEEKVLTTGLDRSRHGPKDFRELYLSHQRREDS